jgi:hypothetical protein
MDMGLQSSGGKVVFFAWTDDRGLVETVKTFRSLDELFAHCLSSGAHGYVEEVLINGVDEKGVAREVALTFRSVSQPLPVTAEA